MPMKKDLGGWGRASAKNVILDILNKQADLLKVLGNNRWDLDLQESLGNTFYSVFEEDGEMIGAGLTPSEAILDAIKHLKETE